MPRVLHVAVVGSGSAEREQLVLAEEVGRLLATRGALVVCGGLGGVMEAACRGAKSAGGTTVGILPGLDRREANAWVDVAIPTGLGEARNALVVRTADVLVAIGGEYGTLSEIALALKTGKPVVGIDTWELARRGVAATDVVRASTPAQAVERVLQLAGTEPTMSSAAPALEATISDRIRRIWQAYKNGDIDAHNGLLAEDYTAIFPDGSLHLRRPTLEEIRANPMSSYALSEVQVAPVTPDAALATYLADVEGPLHGKWTHIRWRVGEVWIQREGEWKCRSYQPTPVAPAPGKR